MQKKQATVGMKVMRWNVGQAAAGLSCPQQVHRISHIFAPLHTPQYPSLKSVRQPLKFSYPSLHRDRALVLATQSLPPPTRLQALPLCLNRRLGRAPAPALACQQKQLLHRLKAMLPTKLSFTNAFKCNERLSMCPPTVLPPCSRCPQRNKRAEAP